MSEEHVLLRKPNGSRFASALEEMRTVVSGGARRRLLKARDGIPLRGHGPAESRWRTRRTSPVMAPAWLRPRGAVRPHLLARTTSSADAQRVIEAQEVRVVIAVPQQPRGEIGIEKLTRC